MSPLSTNPGQHPLSPFAQQALIQRLRQMQQQWMMPQAGGSMGPPMPMSPGIGAQNVPEASPTLGKMMGQGEGPSAQFFNRMQGARAQGLQREKDQQGLMGPPAPAAGPPAPAPGVARVAPGMAPYQPPGMAPAGAQGLQPNARALIDAMTGKRVHKGMGGEQLGMAGVDPALRYMLYAQRGRRHLSGSGKDIY